ncbi:MAG: methionyl-tRNA formyltransferase [Candidatus Omnitrophica bacterium]|nr:methionyl-tRNA formyltransferase [Candidatus Omnitrophota bacterium]MDD5652662.1 methionyl-tRNA formyltransferase [Candidatus Omnitrophota bacterium]
MNIVFFGSSHFAAPSLEALIREKYNVTLVVTQPDKKSGRGMHPSHTVIKSVAQGSSIGIYQPENINSKEAASVLKKQNADLFVVIAYGQILTQAVLDIPKIFAINLHASLLPEYRGAAPINRAIINGVKTTGITVIKMNRKMDAGEVFLKKETEISQTDTVIDLESRLSEMAAQALIEALRLIKDKNYKLVPQDDKEASFAPKLHKSDGEIHWEEPAETIYNSFRGTLNWPGSFTYYRGKLLRVCKLSVYPQELEKEKLSAGTVTHIFKDSIVVACGKGALLIEELQLEGKRKMPVQEFLSGHKISLGEVLGKK